MSTSADLVAALKAELRIAGLTYGDVAKALGLAESSVKRLFAKGDLPLHRVDAVLRLLRMDFAELARKVADAQPLLNQLSLEQERLVIANPQLLLMAICCLSRWSFEQVTGTYAIDAPAAVLHLTTLDRLGIIELRPLNRYRLKVAKTFRWRPDGPVMRYFRAHVVDDYFAGSFDGKDDLLLLTHGHIGRDAARGLNERLARLAEDFAQQHFADQRLPSDQKRPYTLVIGMRSWWFEAFTQLRRTPATPAQPETAVSAETPSPAAAAPRASRGARPRAATGTRRA